MTSPLPMECSTTELRERTLERVAGIEPASSAWKAEVLPLNYTRIAKVKMVEGDGFEPSKLSRQIYNLLPLATREPPQDFLTSQHC